MILNVLWRERGHTEFVFDLRRLLGGLLAIEGHKWTWALAGPAVQAQPRTRKLEAENRAQDCNSVNEPCCESKNNPVGKYNQRTLYPLSVFDSIQVKIKQLQEKSVGFPTAVTILLGDILQEKEVLFQLRAEDKRGNVNGITIIRTNKTSQILLFNPIISNEVKQTFRKT